MRVFANLFVLAIVAMAWPGEAQAQSHLRWKMKPGEAFSVEVEQHTDSEVSFSGKSARSNIDLTLQLGWKVASADNNSFTIRQTVERIHQRIATRDAGTIEYDSAVAGRQTGQARELAESLKPLVGSEFEMTMTTRGEITSVKPANEAAKALFAATEKGTGADAASQDALQQMLRRPLVVLPEKEVRAGDTWTIASDRTTAAGPLKLETTYQLESLEAKSLAKIAMTAKMQPGAGSKFTIKSVEHSGTIQFSSEEGRVVEVTQTQKLLTERPYRETTIVVTLESKQTTTVKAKP